VFNLEEVIFEQEPVGMYILYPEYHPKRKRLKSPQEPHSSSQPLASTEEVSGLVLWFRQEARERRLAQQRFSFVTWGGVCFVAIVWICDLFTGQYSMEWIFSHWLLYLLVLGAVSTRIGISHIQRNIALRLSTQTDPNTIGVLLQARDLGEEDLTIVVDRALMKILDADPPYHAISFTAPDRTALNHALYKADWVLVACLLPLAAAQGNIETRSILQRLLGEWESVAERDAVLCLEECLAALSARLEMEAMPHYLLRATAEKEPPQLLLRPARDTAEPTQLLRSAFSAPPSHTDETLTASLTSQESSHAHQSTHNSG
jgi:hypothetical protein